MSDDTELSRRLQSSKLSIITVETGTSLHSQSILQISQRDYEWHLINPEGS